MARVALAGWTQRTIGARLWSVDPAWPIGTLVVNLLGCFALGLLGGAAERAAPELRLVLGAGFLGAFTTFSTFGVEALDLLQRNVEAALLYLATSVVGGLIAAWGGLTLARAFG